MSSTQKGLLAVVGSSSVDGLFRDFSFSHTFNSQLEELDFQYAYLTTLVGGCGADLNLGLLCKIKSVTVSRVETRWAYTFGVSEILSRLKNPGWLHSSVNDVGHWTLFDWDFESHFADSKSGVDDHCIMYSERPSVVPPLTIKEAIERLAATYEVESSSITISISGR